MTLQDSNSDSLVLQHVDAESREPSANEQGSNSSKRRVVRALADSLRFGKYQIVQLIAVGGMSEVYEAIHLGLDKHVALKVMRPDLAENLEARQRFVAEGRNAASIRHSNVVDVVDVGLVGDLPYLVMELLEGEDLGMVYDRQRPLPVEELIDLLLPVACAVAVGHAKGVIHRDLKPDNIFLHNEGRRVIPKVLDFGVSRAISARSITLNASVFGTPHYMSPEQARGHATDERSDQYSLGVILYEGLTGELPRDAQNALQLLHAVAYEPFAPPSAHVALPPELEAVILRAMAHEPDQRFESMTALALALLPFASESTREYWQAELDVNPRPRDNSAEVPVSEARRRTSRPGIIRNADRLDGHSTPAVLVNAPEASDQPLPLPAAEPARAGSRGRKLTLAALILAAGAAAAVFTVRRSGGDQVSVHGLRSADQRTESYEVDVQATPDSARLELDGVPVGIGHYRARLAKDGSRHTLALAADGCVSQVVYFQDTPPPRQITLARVEPEVVSPSEPPARVTERSPGRTVVATRPPNKPKSSAKRSPVSASGLDAEHSPTTSHKLGAATEASAASESPAAAESEGSPSQPKVRVLGAREPRVQLVE